MRTAGLEEAPEGSEEEAKGLKGCGHWGGLQGLHRQCTLDQDEGQVGEWPVAGGVCSAGSSLGAGGRGNGRRG